MRATVIVPFHRNLSDLTCSLTAVRQSAADAEIVVAADGPLQDCGPLARAVHARVVEIDGPSGPATARNRAAAAATGDVLVFVDADVVVAPDAIDGMCRLLEAEPDVAAVFGAYDHAPAARDFMSQFKNLSHAYVHERGRPDASTFWAGLGAVRASAFRETGGFDERFRKPSIEDIELGYRLRAAGHRIRLDSRFRGTHLKQWSVSTSIRTDIVARGVPWTQLILRSRPATNDLNLGMHHKLSVVVAYVMLAALAAAPWTTPWSYAIAAVMPGLLVGLNRDYYGWLRARRGLLFALGAVPAHLVHHLCNGISFAIGALLHAGSRLGLKLPGALPSDPWTGPAPRPAHRGVDR